MINDLLEIQKSDFLNKLYNPSFSIFLIVKSIFQLCELLYMDFTGYVTFNHGIKSLFDEKFGSEVIFSPNLLKPDSSPGVGI